MFRKRVAAAVIAVIALSGCSDSDTRCDDARHARAEAVATSTQNREVSEILSKYAAWEAADELVAAAC